MRWKTFVLPLLILAGLQFGYADDVTKPNATEAPGKSAAPQPVPLNQQGTVLIDVPHQRLLLKTKVCLRRGVLEMFLCLKQTKEHESIVTIDADAVVIHAGLLALGAVPGHPARFDPQFQPPQGQRIEIFVNWKGPDGTAHRRPAQEWVRHVTHRYFSAPLDSVPDGVVLDKGDDTLRYDPAIKELLWFGTMSEAKFKELQAMSSDKAYREALKTLYEKGQPRQMKAHWVFAGSGFSTLMDGTQWYQAQAGTVICVANFGDAMIDVDIESSDSNAGLLFEPYTERVPEVGTEVTVELIPVFPKKQRDEPGSASGANRTPSSRE